MAAEFLNGLHEIDWKDLPDGSRCMICLSVYGTDIKERGAAETVVRLPCGHDVGADCIRTWLSPDKEARNSCPACRSVFFPAQPRPYMEHGLFESDGSDEDVEVSPGATFNDWVAARNVVNSTFIRDVVRLVGVLWQPPRDWPEVDTNELDPRDFIRSFWPQLLVAPTEQYQESIQRARAAMTGFQIWYPHPDLLDAWLPIRTQDIDPRELEDMVQDLATAYRTLSFREALVYQLYRQLNDGSEIERSPRGPVIQPLDVMQQHILFHEMQRDGAFPRNYSERLTNRQRWQRYRDCGEAWNPLTRNWSPKWENDVS